MTEVGQDQQPQSEELFHGPPAHQQTTIAEAGVHQHSTVDSPSDNDANERSAREKFKKTSLASLHKQTFPSETVFQGKKDSSTVEFLAPVATESNDSANHVSRGDLVGKRALEDESINFSKRDSIVEYEQPPEPSNGHTRKRSRDVRAGEHVKGNERLYDSCEELVQERDEDSTGSEDRGTPVKVAPEYFPVSEKYEHKSLENPAHSKSGEGSILLGTDNESASEGNRQVQGRGIEEERKPEDEEMKDGAYSPRKKRSRDQMEAVADREQKIAATEETRAQRRSDELDRADTSLHQGITSSEKISSHTAIAFPPTTFSGDSKPEATKSEAPKATFGATNMLRPSPSSLKSKSATKALDESYTEAEPGPTPTQSAFASSGFASFASSSHSPFGTVGASSTPTVPDPSHFAKVPAGMSDPQDPGSTGGSSFTPFSKASPADIGRTKFSSFAFAGSKVGTTFGGAPFGGSFGSGFGGGSKLTSFAAPTGDAKLGGANGSSKPIGTSSNDDGDKNGSETEDEGEDDNSKNDEFSEADDRFQHQDIDTGEDGEDTIFSSRAKLYAFKENNWKEAGNGIFKLNVISSKDAKDEHKTSRFIMRAHQTYRVLLNQLAFPQMKVGDRSGNEPTGKTFAFAVIVDGKPIPHMVKFSDVNESKTLYHEVIRLQDSTAEGMRTRKLDQTVEV